jgi:hypothetical protein
MSLITVTTVSKSKSIHRQLQSSVLLLAPLFHNRLDIKGARVCPLHRHQEERVEGVVVQAIPEAPIL